MREIEFRGLDNRGIWHYGFYWETPTGLSFIKERMEKTHFADFEVIPETVGQYIGRLDITKEKIYQGDFLDVFNWGRTNELLGRTVVVWDNDELGWRYSDSSELMTEDIYDQFRRVKRVGTIHETPEQKEE